ncbi:hypothetical protein KKF91_08540 [Myxococcota bacterium]|nr:hypothetical protein [Myxococcota bacterium]
MMRCVTLLVLALAACSPADPVPLRELPDAAPRPDFALADGAARLDWGAPLDAASDTTSDAASDAASDATSDATSDADAAPPPDGDVGLDDADLGEIDALPLDAPAEEIIALSTRSDVWLAWRAGTNLRAARMEGDAVGDPVEVGRGAALYAARTSGGHPYLFVPDGPGGLIQLHDLEDGTISPLGQPEDLASGAPAIGLYPPLRLAVRGEQIIALGYSQGPSLGPLSWQVITRGVPSAPILDHRGLAFPQQVAAALEQWVFVYGEGVCVALDSDHALGEHWGCAAFEGAASVGLEQQLYHAGWLDGALQLTQGMPIQDHTPITLDTPPAAILRWLPPHTDGPTALVGERAYLFTSVSVHRSAPLPEDTLGVSFYRRVAKALIWGVDRPALVPIEVEDLQPPPPIFRPEGCTENIAPEACDAADADCDGLAKAGLCCGLDNGVRRAKLPTGWLPRRPFVISESDVGLIAMMAFEGDVARLVKHPDEAPDGAEVQIMASWEGVARLVHFDSQRALIVAYVEDVADAEGLASHSLRLFAPAEEGGLPSALTHPAPCEGVLAVELLDAAGHARVFCPTEAVDLRSTTAEMSPLSYPEGAEVRWMRRAFVGEGAGAWLVARGEAAILELWLSTPEGLALAPLPADLSALVAVEDRALPIQIPGAGAATFSRVVDQRLEVWSGAGWINSPSSSWPVDAKLSPSHPFALSVGFTRDPQANPGREALGLYVHDLRADHPHWGRRVYTTLSRVDIPEMGYRDLAPLRRPDHDSPALFVLQGDISRPDQAELTLTGFDLSCQ